MNNFVRSRMITQLSSPGRTGSWARIVHILMLITLLIPFAPVQASQTRGEEPDNLDLESRLAYHLAVEEIYWQHRIWPAENPQPKPALGQVVSIEALQAQVEDALRKTNALEDLFGRPITGGQLQAELDRMISSSRQPAVLTEIFTALGNDPHIIAEIIALPALADRLLRSWYEAGDSDEASFDAWWNSERFRFSPLVDAPDYEYRLSLSRLNAQDNTWTPTPALPEGLSGSSAVWTGAEMIIWGGVSVHSGARTNNGSRYNPATDTWLTTASLGSPEPRGWHTAVWTGSEMVVWGGCDQSSEFCTVSSGGRYNPVTDSWTPTNFSGAPSDRMEHTAVWTGTEMIIWGGCSIGSQGNNYCNLLPEDGGIYDPTSDSWQPTSQTSVPSGRTGHKAVWVDGLMVVWGGHDGIAVTNTGGRYDPSTDTWQPTTLSGAPTPRSTHSMVSTGSESIVWGGCTNSLCLVGDTYFDTGAVYDPSADSWTETSFNDAPTGRSSHSAVWAGSEMIIWGGRSVPGSNFSDGSRYDPLTNTWTPTSNTSVPSARHNHHAVWTGSEMIVWGGSSDPGLSRTGGRYNPDLDSWVPTNTNDPVFAKERHMAVWTGTEMLIWGGSTAGIGEFFGLGNIFDGVTGTWSLMSQVNEPEGRFFHTAVWTGSEMIVWGGQYGTSVFDTGGRYDPITDAWTLTSTSGAPDGRAYHAAVWSGSEMIVFGGSTYEELFTNTGGRYNPSTNSWSLTTTTNAPSPRAHMRGVWADSEMIVWGGYTEVGDTNTGARYNPSANTWTSMSTASAPTGRHFNTAVWTGTELIVWGGMSGTLDDGTWYNTGGRYDPSADSWTATSTTDAPSPRVWHVDAWTGEELIVWGGCTGSTSCSDEIFSGGRYNPLSDGWTATSLQSVPSARSNSAAVWTGEDMIVWGGYAEVGSYTSTGGFYHVSDQPNTAPVSLADAYSTEEGVLLVVDAPGVLGNDSDAESDTLSAVLVSGTISGTLLLDDDGSFSYMPDPGFNGSDSFTYVAFDGSLYGAETPVTLTVTALPPGEQYLLFLPFIRK